MVEEPIPHALTSGQIARRLGVPHWRVRYVLATRPHIRPALRAGNTWLYNRDTVAKVRHELNAIDARRCRQGMDHDERPD